MQNKENLFSRIKNFFAGFSPKNKLKYIILGIVVLIPGIIAVLNYVFVTNGIQFEMPDVYYVTLYDYKDEVIADERDVPKYSSSSSLVNIFYTMSERISRTSSFSPPEESENAVRAVIKSADSEREYRCYFSFYEDSSYCTDPTGQVYKIDDRDVVKFLSSKYSEIMYDTAEPPQMLSNTGDTVLPVSAEWNYRAVSDKFFPSDRVKTTETTVIYDMAGGLGLSFGAEPDDCTVKIFLEDSQIYEGQYSGISQITFDTGTILHLYVSAEWYQSDDCEYYGSLIYEFDVFVRDRSEFYLSDDTVEAGGFTVISGTHITDVSKISFSCYPDTGLSPVFMSNGENVFAAMAFPTDTEPGIYTLTLKYGATVQKLELTVTARTIGNIYYRTDAESDAVSAALDSKAYSEFLEKVNSVYSSLPDTAFIREGFLSPTGNGGTVAAGFGDIAEFGSSGKSYTYDGNLYTYSQKGGAAVTALNSGKIVAAGYCAYLGNYVAIYHGYGICTWYAHLSEVTVSVGDMAVKNEQIGKTGTGGISGDEGVYIICTVSGVCVDPECLFGKTI